MYRGGWAGVETGVGHQTNFKVPMGVGHPFYDWMTGMAYSLYENKEVFQ